MILLSLARARSDLRGKRGKGQPFGCFSRRWHTKVAYCPFYALHFSGSSSPISSTPQQSHPPPQPLLPPARWARSVNRKATKKPKSCVDIKICFAPQQKTQK